MNRNHAPALAGTATIVAVVIAAVVGFGREARHARMGAQAEAVD